MSNQDLGRHIEELIQAHIAASRTVAREAVERAFASTDKPPTPVKASVPRQVRSSRRGSRTAEEMAALRERLYRTVCAKPGETMIAYKAEVGATARELERPMGQLKRSGRVRSVKAGHVTRYFPMASAISASA